MAILAALSTFLAAAALVFGLTSLRAEAAATVDRRLGRAKGLEPAADGGGDLGVALRGSRFSRNGGMAKTLAGIRSAQMIGNLLERSGWRLSVIEFLALSGVTAIALFFVMSAVLPVISLLGAIVGAFVPFVLLRWAVKRRRDKFVSQLVDALTLLANALKAGVGLMQALDQAASQSKAPLADEFNKLLHDVRIGAVPDDAFAALSERMQSDDLDIVITGIIVQRSTGGNLAEMLENVGHVMRERIRIKGEIKTLTAQQQLSGYLVGALPILLLIGFNFMNHAYVEPLFTTKIGHMMLAGGGTLQLMGFAMIRKIVNIKV